MIVRMTLSTLLTAWLIISFLGNAIATSAGDPLSRAYGYLNQGYSFLALQEAESALKNAKTKTQQSQAYGMKGNILLLMQRYKEAEKSLLQAFDLAEVAQHKADYANSLGVLYHEMRDKKKPEQYFKLALELADNKSALPLKIKLNRLHAQPGIAESSLLNELLVEISTMDFPDERVKYYLNLAAIAKSHGSEMLLIAQSALEKAQVDSTHINDKQLQVEMLDSLAELYEMQGKYQQALQLSEQASTMSTQMDVDDLLIDIEWRKGRVYQRQGRDEEALIAYGKAVEHIQAIRRDIPVTYEDGKSSFRKTLEPVYTGYAHHLLKKAAQQEGAIKQRTLLLARQTIEQIKQSELEDFLGGRCLIEGLHRSELQTMDTDAAILYPIILPDRLELLVGIGNTIHQYTVSIPENRIHDEALSLSSSLRSPYSTRNKNYQQFSENLYHWIITPIEKDLAEKTIKTLVIVPDGALRLVPFAALFDGERYLIEKYALSISPGMSLLGEVKNTRTDNFRSLLAGLSKPGPVVEKLPSSILSAILQPESRNISQHNLPRGREIFIQHLRSITSESKLEASQNSETLLKPAGALQKVQQELSLPGVETELNNLNKTLRSTTLLNEQFTVNSFYKQVSSAPYEIIHVASHGIFSSDADSSFLLAYDDVVKLDDLKTLLKRDERNAQGSIQLLTFSACQTAEGDDRAPLGFAGAALKAEALSALGSLWPISDEAAAQLMVSFYKKMTQHLGKAESLRQAQLELLKHPSMQHPFFWSPFILVGNWL